MNFEHPELWWPWELGSAPLRFNLDSDEKVETPLTLTNAIRHPRGQDYITPEGYRGYMVNGKKILLRGGGWADDLLLRENETNLDAQMRYTQGDEFEHHPARGLWG